MAIARIAIYERKKKHKKYFEIHQANIGFIFKFLTYEDIDRGRTEM